MPRYWEILAKLKKEPTEMDKIRSGTLSYTGRGENGILEPSKPAGVDYSSGKPIMLHEGETVEEIKGGKIVTPARVVPFNTEEEQAQAYKEEQRLRIPGMQTGGYIPYSPEQTDVSNQTPITSNMPELGKRNLLVPPTSTQYGLPMPNTQSTQKTQATQATPTSQTKGLLNLGIDTTKNIVTGQNSVFDLNKNQMLGRLGASQAAQTGAMQQNVAQQGLSAPVSNVLGANLQRQQNIAQGQVASDLATQEANAQQQAAKDLTTLVTNDYNIKQAEIDDLIALGGEENINKAQELASSLYGFDIDYSKAKLPDLQNTMVNIETWIQKYGAKAPAEVLETMGNKYFDIWEQSNAIQGLTFTPEEKQQILTGIMSGDAETGYEGMKIGSTIIDWWDKGEGSPLKLMLTGQMKDYQDIINDPKTTSDMKAEASQMLGQLVGTAYYAAKGYIDYLTEDQKKLLTDSGLDMLSGSQAEAKQKSEEARMEIQKFLSGDRFDWMNAYKDPEIWEAVKDSVQELPEIPGVNEKVSVGVEKTALGTQGNVTGLASLNKLKKGEFVKYNDKYFEVQAPELNEKGKDYVTYVFKDPATGKEYRIYLGAAFGGKNLEIKKNELEDA